MQDPQSDRPPGPTEPQSHPRRRPWIGVFFECCNVYARIYRRPDQPRYTGKCPNCRRQVAVPVGPDGVSTRIFRASTS